MTDPAAVEGPPLDLEPIQRRADALAIEPWFYVHGEGCQQPHTVGEGHPGRWTSVCSSPWDHEPAKCAMEFIAHARQDIPALIAEVERLRAALLASSADRERLTERAIEHFKETIWSEHDTATMWPKGSERKGHKGEFDTCPHPDCVLVRQASPASPAIDSASQTAKGPFT